jgi:hypothetical protein
MNYLVKWQFTQEKPSPYRTQTEIIRTKFTPLLEDKSFQDKRYSFYVTRMWGQDVRLAVFVKEENLQDVLKIVKSYTKELILHPFDFDERMGVWTSQKHDWDGEPRETKYTFTENPIPGEYFHTKFLEDIAWIGVGLQKMDLTEVIQFSVRARFETKPYGDSDPKEFFHDYFSRVSERYCSKNNSEIDKFWGENGYYYTGSSAPGPHFYYNIALGSDFGLPRQFLNHSERERVTSSVLAQMLSAHGLTN